MISETLEVILERFPEEFQDNDNDLPSSLLLLACFTGSFIFVIYVLIGCYGNMRPMHVEVNPNDEDLMDDLGVEPYPDLSYFLQGDEVVRDERDDY